MTWFWLLLIAGLISFFVVAFAIRFCQVLHEWDEEIEEMHKEKSDAKETPHK